MADRPVLPKDKEAEAVAARLYAAEDTSNARRAFLEGVRWGRAHPEEAGKERSDG